MSAPPVMEALLQRHLGFVPRCIAVMGKWEPTMKAARCLAEVAARAAAALALSEAAEPHGPGPFLLSAEGFLKGMTRPGCQTAASILLSLGARPGRVRVWPAANRTVVEVQSFHRMRRRLGGGGLLLLTGGYHVPRTRHILQRTLRSAEPVQVLGVADPLVSEALARLPSSRALRLSGVIEAGTRRGLARLPVTFSEVLAFLTGAVPGLERRIADALRGPVELREELMFPPIDSAPSAQ